MPMASDFELHAEPLQLMCYIKVIKHGGVHRIMINEYATSFIFKGLQPIHRFFRYESRSHSHIRTAVAAYESPTLMLERETFVTKHFHKGIASALRPVCIVIALNNIIWKPQRIQHTLGDTDFFVSSEVSQIAPEYDEIQRIVSVYI